MIDSDDSNLTAIYPPDRPLGCLPRRSKPGEWCPMLGDRIKVIPREEWPAAAERIGDSLRRKVPAVLDQDGVGCHDEKTEVLTEAGWQAWPNYDNKSALGTINPCSGQLEFQHPTALHSFDYDGEMYALNHRSMDCVVTPNHRMWVRLWNESQRKIEDKFVFCDIDKAGWYMRMQAAPTGFVGTELKSVKVGQRTYSGDDFLALLALIASDGWVGGTESTRNKVSFCCFRDDRATMVRELAGRLGLHDHPGRQGVWVWSDGELANWLQAKMYVGGEYRSPFKRVPDIVKVASGRQASHFLKFYGDQHVEGDRRSFYTSSSQMADDIQELVLRTGKRASICVRPPRASNFRGRDIAAAHNEYIVTEWTSSKLSLEKKKLERFHYRGGVFCATVPNAILVTRRNGQVLISGNSCAAEAATGALMVARSVVGLDHVLLNPWYLYHFTSHGVDSGSSIDENLVVARDRGIAPESVWPRSRGWRARPSAEAHAAAAEFRIEEFYDISSVDEFVTALLLGFAVEFGARGHAVLAVRHRGSYPEILNSWGRGWGDGGFGSWVSYSGINWAYGAWAIRLPNQKLPDNWRQLP